MEIKYTTDGRKVCVVGSLNAQEKIVQEIFISNGSEIPSGENFVVKSLHDAPAKSWKQTELEKIEKEYETTRPRQQKEIEEWTRKHRSQLDDIKARIEYVTKVGKNISPESFQPLIDFLTGSVKWIVKTQYTIEILPFEQFHKAEENSLKLITLFGQDDGTLCYRLNRWSDGSGGNESFKPFKTYEEAKDFAQQKLDSKESVSDSDLKLAAAHGLILDSTKLEKYKQSRIADIEKNIQSSLKNIEDQKAIIEEISKISQ
jgi:hypothetical protein